MAIDWREIASEYTRSVFSKMEQGSVEYGEKSHHSPIHETLHEISAEFLDVGGWGAIGWGKVQRLIRRVEDLERELADIGKTIDEIRAAPKDLPESSAAGTESTHINH